MHKLIHMNVEPDDLRPSLIRVHEDVFGGQREVPDKFPNQQVQVGSPGELAWAAETT